MRWRPARPRGVAAALLLIALAGVIVAAAVAIRWATRPTFVPLEALPDIACETPAAGSGRVFHVDPARGTPDGDGSAARPWRDLASLADRGLIGDGVRRIGVTNRILGVLAHGPALPRTASRPGSLVRGGDTLILASGDYGAVDLSQIANRAFLTIAAAPGAEVRFASLNLAGASRFVLRGITVKGDAAVAGGNHLVSTYRADLPRAEHILFDRIAVAGAQPLASIDAEPLSDRVPDGMILGGDCLGLIDSTLHDLESGVNIYRGRRVTVSGTTIRDILVDGVQFSGRDLTIRSNVIVNQYPGDDNLHPDCMQGQPPFAEPYGPVAITGNRCIRRLAGETGEAHVAAASARDTFGWQGISIFDGRWSGVRIACNLVLPAAQHGIALYGAADALVEGNVVVGLPRGEPSWIAALPSKEGRAPDKVVIRGNRASAYLNAVHGSGEPLARMIEALRVHKEDLALMDMLAAPIAGVTLAGNAWLVFPGNDRYARTDPRFRWETVAAPSLPASVEEAAARYPLPAGCGRS